MVFSFLLPYACISTDDIQNFFANMPLLDSFKIFKNLNCLEIP